MKLLKSIFATAMALALSGCMGLAAADMLQGAINSASNRTAPSTSAEARESGGIAVIEDRVVVRGEQALTGAALMYESIAILINAGVDTGLIHGQMAGTIQGYNNQALTALRAGYRATSSADKARFAAQAQRAIGFINDLPVIGQVRGLLIQRNVAPAGSAPAHPST